MDRLHNYSFGIHDPVILDVGCGEGEFIEELIKTFPGYSMIHALDVDDDMLDLVNKKFSSQKINTIKAGIEKLPYDDEYFDVVSMSRTFHHLPDLQVSLSETVRVMKKNAYFIINEMIYDNQSQRQEVFMEAHHFKGDIDMIFGIYHHDTFSSREIEEILDTNGLRIVYLFYYLDDTGIVCPPPRIEAKKNEILQNLERLEGRPEYAEYRDRGHKIINKLDSIGLWGPRHIAAVCMKK